MLVLLAAMLMTCPLYIYNNSAYKLFLFDRMYYDNLTFDSSNLTCTYLTRLLDIELNYLKRILPSPRIKIKTVQQPGEAAAVARLLEYDEEYLRRAEESFNSSCSGACTSKYFVLYTMLSQFYDVNSEAMRLINSPAIENITGWSHAFMVELATFNPASPLPSPAQVEGRINSMIEYIQSTLSSLES